MAWNVRDRLQKLALELGPAGDERFQQPSVGIAVRAKLARRVVDRAPHENRGTVVEGVGNNGGRLDQVELEPQ